MNDLEKADAKLTQLAETSRNPMARSQDTDKKSEGSAAFSKFISHGT